MMKIIDRARVHFNQVRHHDVPEWLDEAGAPTRIYWKPLTLDEQQKLRAMREAAKDDDINGMLRILISKAEESDGQKLFSIEDRPALRGAADATIIERIVIAMTRSDGVEQAEKN